MNRTQRLGFAAVAVAALVALAALFAHQREPAAGTAASGPWLIGLKEAMKDVKRVDLASGKVRTSLRRDGESWGVAEREAYPVDRERLADLLKELAAARAIESKTSKPEFFGKLGLEDIDKPGSSAVLVEIWQDDKGPAWRVLVGNAAEGRNGRYLRRADSQETWLVDRSPQAFSDPADWIDRKILGLDFAGVASVSRTKADVPLFEASRKDASVASLSVVALPAGKRARYDSVFDAAARAVLTAEAEDVRKAGDALFADASLVHNRITFFDGLVLDIDAVKASDGNWIRVKASGTGAGVASLDARLTGWAFKISDYIQGELSKPLDEYIEPEKADAGKADDKPT